MLRWIQLQEFPRLRLRFFASMRDLIRLPELVIGKISRKAADRGQLSQSQKKMHRISRRDANQRKEFHYVRLNHRGRFRWFIRSRPFFFAPSRPEQYCKILPDSRLYHCQSAASTESTGKDGSPVTVRVRGGATSAISVRRKHHDRDFTEVRFDTRHFATVRVLEA
jgi:hypothetical protein